MVADYQMVEHQAGFPSMVADCQMVEADSFLVPAGSMQADAFGVTVD
jgi:hypothetical protein